MPIVNGQYVYDTMPKTGHDAFQSATGEKWSKKDWSDDTTALYNYMLKQQENAFNLEMWNLSNEYNSPANQMLRYQQAGLNPNLIYSQQNTTSPMQAAVNQAFRSSGNYSKYVQNQLATIGQMESIIKSARDTYDYLKFGREQRSWDIALSRERGYGQSLENLWNEWLLGRGSDDTVDPSAPKRVLWQTQADTKEQEWKKLEYFVRVLQPDQHRASSALSKLRENQADIQNGKFGAILDIDLGLGEKVNQWARLVLFIMMSRMM